MAGCVSDGAHQGRYSGPVTGSISHEASLLSELEPPPSPIPVAVYDFPDLTGAHRPNPEYADYSQAVTQGGGAVVVDALKSAGQGRWFKVVERTRLDDLLRERKLIQDTAAGLGQDGASAVAPLEFARYLVGGGIISYDASTLDGGIGASYLGIGGKTSYRRDEVTVTLRLVEVANGNVVESVTVTNSVYSVGVSATLSKYVSSDLLDIRTGFTRSKPAQFAVREAIERGVLEMTKRLAERDIGSEPTLTTASVSKIEAPAAACIVPQCKLRQALD